MNVETVYQRLADVKSKLSKLSSYLSAMEEMNIRDDPECYSLISNNAALQAEGIACQFRNLLFASSGILRSEYLVDAAETHGIEVEYENRIFSVKLPRILPKKKARHSDLFLLDPIHAALEFYRQKEAVPKYTECVVCVVHVYDRTLPEWCILDYDNMQQKQVIDAIAAHVLVDDSALLCDAYNTTELGDTTCTYVYIMEKECFPAWLKERENEAENI